MLILGQTGFTLFLAQGCDSGGSFLLVEVKDSEVSGEPKHSLGLVAVLKAGRFFQIWPWFVISLKEFESFAKNYLFNSLLDLKTLGTISNDKTKPIDSLCTYVDEGNDNLPALKLKRPYV